LILLGRDRAKLEKVAALARSAGARAADFIELDLASFASIHSAAAKVAERTDTKQLTIDAVVANAGIQMGGRSRVTDDGLETTFGVNVVGNQLLVQLLRRHLTNNAHVVVVGSGTHFGDPLTRMLVAAPVWQTPAKLAEPISADADSPKAGQCAYSTSKLGVNYLVHELNNRWPSPLRANVYDPGLMPGTGLARDLPSFKQWAWNNIMPALTILPGVATTKTSAERLARLTLGEEHPGARNEYIEIGKLSKASNESFNPERERELWEYCEQITLGNRGAASVPS
jgi:NAD(P)-dependent dehydrogenase (short-subunit alcohol dehydrogenase family)